jgi:sarcosine oxidase subunit gamma
MESFEALSAYVGGIEVRENFNTALASYASRRGKEKRSQQVLEKYCGHKCPGPGNAVLDTISVFWMAPDQWMVIADYQTYENLAEQLMAVAKGNASITEQSDAWCRFDLEGAGLADVFERLCPLNIRAFKGGEASRTSIEHIGCFVIFQSAERISVLGPRSSAGSLHHAIITAINSVN